MSDAEVMEIIHIHLPCAIRAVRIGSIKASAVRQVYGDAAWRSDVKRAARRLP